MMLADAAAQARDASALVRYAPALEELAIRDGHRPYQAIAHRAWGIAQHLAGEHGKAEARLNQALELFEELGTRWQLGRTLFEIAELDLARSDGPGARRHFTRALEEFEAMKAEPDAERTRMALEACP